jgi:hypothetical protein
MTLLNKRKGKEVVINERLRSQECSWFLAGTPHGKYSLEGIFGIGYITIGYYKCFDDFFNENDSVYGDFGDANTDVASRSRRIFGVSIVAIYSGIAVVCIHRYIC